MLDVPSDSQHLRAAQVIILRGLFYIIFYKYLLTMHARSPFPLRLQSDTGACDLWHGTWKKFGLPLTAGLWLDTGTQPHKRTASRVQPSPMECDLQRPQPGSMRGSSTSIPAQGLL